MNIPNAHEVVARTQKHQHCDVHNGNGQAVHHSLALRRVKGVWVPTTCCVKCLRELTRAAKAEGKFIPIYGLEASKAEAARRNEESLKFKPFLAKFGKARPRKEELKPIKAEATPASTSK